MRMNPFPERTTGPFTNPDYYAADLLRLYIVLAGIIVIALLARVALSVWRGRNQHGSDFSAVSHEIGRVLVYTALIAAMIPAIYVEGERLGDPVSPLLPLYLVSTTLALGAAANLVRFKKRK